MPAARDDNEYPAHLDFAGEYACAESRSSRFDGPAAQAAVNANGKRISTIVMIAVR
jgi:hypothetical protein